MASIETARRSGPNTVLTQVLTGGGGVGKSQFAAMIAHQAFLDRNVDLVMWIDASRVGGIISAYASAATALRLPDTGNGQLEAAARLVSWLATTDRPWLVVLDDITDPDALGTWWPASHTGSGRVLATTRRRDAAFSGAGRVRIDVDVYDPAESLAYLAERLTGAGVADLCDDGAAPLADALGNLPLALSHAAAYMTNEHIRCVEYYARFRSADRMVRVLGRDADADGYGRQIDATLLLAVEAAQAADPPGLALPALCLASVLDAAGHPEALWATTAVTAYLSAYRSSAKGRRLARRARRPEPVTGAGARRTLRVLHRYGLITHDPEAGLRAVRIHALTARAARETAENLAATARAAADGLAELWPTDDYDLSDRTEALRASALTLTSCAGVYLWATGAHPVPFRAGSSLLVSGLYATAADHWRTVADQAEAALGPGHPDTMSARGSLASAYWADGRAALAIAKTTENIVFIAHLPGPYLTQSQSRLFHDAQDDGVQPTPLVVV